MQEYYEKVGKLFKNMFYCTIDRMEEETFLKRGAQTKAVDTLVEMGLIEKKMMGLPAKRYFRVIEEAVLKLFPQQEPEIAKVDEAVDAISAQPDSDAGSTIENDQNEQILNPTPVAEDATLMQPRVQVSCSHIIKDFISKDFKKEEEEEENIYAHAREDISIFGERFSKIAEEIELDDEWTQEVIHNEPTELRKYYGTTIDIREALEKTLKHIVRLDTAGEMVVSFARLFYTFYKNHMRTKRAADKFASPTQRFLRAMAAV